MTSDPSIYTIDNPDLTVLNFKGNFFGTQRAKGFKTSLILVYTVCRRGNCNKADEFCYGLGISFGLNLSPYSSFSQIVTSSHYDVQEKPSLPKTDMLAFIIIDQQWTLSKTYWQLQKHQ